MPSYIRNILIFLPPTIINSPALKSGNLESWDSIMLPLMCEFNHLNMTGRKQENKQIFTKKWCCINCGTALTGWMNLNARKFRMSTVSICHSDISAVCHTACGVKAVMNCVVLLRLTNRILYPCYNPP